MIAVFLGAGFSRLAGVPLASQLFVRRFAVDRIKREQLVSRVFRDWQSWNARTGGAPEEYLSHVEAIAGPRCPDAVQFVALSIALRIAEIRNVGGRPQLVRHGIRLTSGVRSHEEFWDTIFEKTWDVSVLTTNYDILLERELRMEPHPRAQRPGFNYGDGPEELAGRGYPSFAHVRKIVTAGRVPIHKLHGSISWAVENGSLRKYADCRPAIRGDASIQAPVQDKRIASFMQPIWGRAADDLRASEHWVIVGYSLPAYDLAIRALLRRNSTHGPQIDLFDPDPDIVSRYQSLLPNCLIRPHGGLPADTQALRELLATI